jgi:hypothetical protein
VRRRGPDQTRPDPTRPFFCRLVPSDSRVSCPPRIGISAAHGLEQKPRPSIPSSAIAQNGEEPPTDAAEPEPTHPRLHRTGGRSWLGKPDREPQQTRREAVQETCGGLLILLFLPTSPTHSHTGGKEKKGRNGRHRGLNRLVVDRDNTATFFLPYFSRVTSDASFIFSRALPPSSLVVILILLPPSATFIALLLSPCLGAKKHFEILAAAQGRSVRSGGGGAFVIY